MNGALIGAKRPHALLRPEIAVPFVLVALIWGSTWFVIKDQLMAAPPSWSVTYRFAIATIGMFALAAMGGRGFRMTVSGHVIAFAIGITQFFLNFNFVYRAEIHLTSGIVAVLFAFLIVPNAVLGLIFLENRITRRFMAGTMIALAGIALLLLHEAREAPVTGLVGLGILFAVLGIFSASTANILQATETARKRPLRVMLAWAMLWGTLADAAFAWSFAGPPVFPSSLRYWGGVAYLGLVGSVITFPLYFGLIRDLGPGRAAYNGVAVPIVAMALSTVFEGYRWSWLAMAGGALALLGLVVAMRGRHAPYPAKSSISPLR
ncbi:drug/metabolite transporter (DMT)-like permease [Altererythrobacter atlanticus]|uniref:DMT superfamily transporter inner membrane protein n=1 Tax=Croceibacterium atlanticum TaxID=1267766 RepID=A0A0F7KSN2_9SPHN|nr:DMT family transporter [Croceibacterium atlanticum]AKH43418.1 putative DMT superfamily transporter inner membrane protein [Croceibacterium atlanticum]MBB5731874.1 drug/metabolite transporter (DMT)-like permease [Croceibacterium atlanticum]